MPTEELKRHPWLLIDAMLAKPFTVMKLLDLVRKHVLAREGITPSSQLFRDCAMLEEEASQVQKLAPVQNQVNFSHRILVVDDNIDTRQLSVDLLAESGYDVQAVNDGVAGWDALQTSTYDLVITDNHMPKMSGVDMIAKLRDARIAVPVIMATASLPMHMFEHNPWLKPDAMLERPFSNDDLLAVVRNVLQNDDGSDEGKESIFPKYL
jgi:CheY-like chemotaxis protein